MGKNIKDVYKFTKKIGSGSYGSVYLARNKETGDEFAAKAIKKSNVENEESFRIEASIARKLDHPNISKVFELWESSDHFFIVF